jgi:hypothetical protein
MTEENCMDPRLDEALERIGTLERLVRRMARSLVGDEGADIEEDVRMSTACSCHLAEWGSHVHDCRFAPEDRRR